MKFKNQHSYDVQKIVFYLLLYCFSCIIIELDAFCTSLLLTVSFSSFFVTSGQHIASIYLKRSFSVAGFIFRYLFILLLTSSQAGNSVLRA